MARNRILGGRGFVGGMEAEDDTNTELDPTTAPAVERGLGEQRMEVANIEDAGAAAEDAEADARTLEAQAQVMDEAVDAGTGVDPNTARMAQITVESICDRLDMPRPRKTVIGKEAFADAQTRVSRTRIASESIKDKAKSIWEAIKKMIARIWEMVKSFFLGFTKNRESLEKHLKDIRDSLENVELNAKPDKQDLEGSYAGVLTPGAEDKATKETAVKLLGVVRNLRDFAKELTNFGKKEAFSMLESGTQAEAQNDTNRKAFIKDTIEGAGLEKVDFKGNGEKPENTEYYGALPSGKSLQVTIKESGSNAAGTATTKVSYSISFVENTRNLATRITALDRGGCSDMIDKAIDQCKELKKFDEVYADLQKAGTDLNKAVESGVKATSRIASSGDANLKDDHDRLSDRAARAREVADYIAKAGSVVPHMVFELIKAVGDGVAASRSNLVDKNKK